MILRKDVELLWMASTGQFILVNQEQQSDITYNENLY